MADQEQVRLLLTGASEWNGWREANPTIQVDLGGADLPGASLPYRNLTSANLNSANLCDANLCVKWKCTGVVHGGDHLVVEVCRLLKFLSRRHWQRHHRELHSHVNSLYLNSSQGPPNVKGRWMIPSPGCCALPG